MGDANSPLGTLGKIPGAEYVLILRPGAGKAFDAYGLGNAEPTADWGRHTLAQFRALGERLQAGPLQQVEGLGPRRNVAMAPHPNGDFCVGWANNLSTAQMQESMKKLLALWVS
jgi:hypothetical protein